MLNNYHKLELVWSEGVDPKLIGVNIGGQILSNLDFLDFLEFFKDRQRIMYTMSQIFELIKEIRKKHCHGY